MQCNATTIHTVACILVPIKTTMTLSLHDFMRQCGTACNGSRQKHAYTDVNWVVCMMNMSPSHLGEPSQMYYGRAGICAGAIRVQCDCKDPADKLILLCGKLHRLCG